MPAPPKRPPRTHRLNQKERGAQSDHGAAKTPPRKEPPALIPGGEESHQQRRTKGSS